MKNRIDAIQMLNHVSRRWSFTLAAVTGVQREINEPQERVDELEEQARERT